MTQKFPSGVIHQKLRLELIQHAGYLVMGLRCVFMPFLMDPDKTLQRYVLYRYAHSTQTGELRLVSILQNIRRTNK